MYFCEIISTLCVVVVVLSVGQINAYTSYYFVFSLSWTPHMIQSVTNNSSTPCPYEYFCPLSSGTGLTA